MAPRPIGQVDRVDREGAGVHRCDAVRQPGARGAAWAAETVVAWPRIVLSVRRS
jgi:hypothetical protein